MPIHSTLCRKCGTKINLDFGDLSYDQARAHLEKLANSARECPGWHVELSGWDYYWNFDELLDAAFPGQHVNRFRTEDNIAALDRIAA